MKIFQAGVGNKCYLFGATNAEEAEAEIEQVFADLDAKPLLADSSLPLWAATQAGAPGGSTYQLDTNTLILN